MSRIPAKPRQDLNPEQQELHDQWEVGATRAFGPNKELFVWADDNGAFIGPLPFMAYHPSAGKPLLAQQITLSKLPIPPAVRETAILTTGTHFQAGFETYSHIPQAVKAGLTQEQAETIVAGKKPKDLNADCALTYDIAKFLITKPGPLPAELWDKGVEVLGKEALVAAVHYVGFYSYVCVFLNAADAPVPE